MLPVLLNHLTESTFPSLCNRISDSNLPKLMRTAIEGPNLINIDFSEILKQTNNRIQLSFTINKKFFSKILGGGGGGGGGGGDPRATPPLYVF